MRRRCRHLVGRFGQIGLAIFGGLLVGLAYRSSAGAGLVDHASSRHRVGLDFICCTIRADQRDTDVAEARGTAVSIFSSALYLGPIGRRVGRFAADRPRRRPAIFIVRAAVAGAPVLVCRAVARRRAAIAPARNAARSPAHEAPTIVGSCCRASAAASGAASP